MRKFRGLRKLRRWMFKHPRQVLRDYDRACAHLLGATSRTPWTYRDVARKISWGKLRSLFRIDSILGDILGAIADKKVGRATVILVQLKKALHQVSLDGGDWRTGALMIPTPDPCGRVDFGGAEAEIEVIAAYKKAHFELQKAQRGAGGYPSTATGAQDEEQAEAGGEAAPGGRRPKKK